MCEFTNEEGDWMWISKIILSLRETINSFYLYILTILNDEIQDFFTFVNKKSHLDKYQSVDKKIRNKDNG